MQTSAANTARRIPATSRPAPKPRAVLVRTRPQSASHLAVKRGQPAGSQPSDVVERKSGAVDVKKGREETAGSRTSNAEEERKGSAGVGERSEVLKTLLTGSNAGGKNKMGFAERWNGEEVPTAPNAEGVGRAPSTEGGNGLERAASERSGTQEILKDEGPTLVDGIVSRSIEETGEAQPEVKSVTQERGTGSDSLGVAMMQDGLGSDTGITSGKVNVSDREGGFVFLEEAGCDLSSRRHVGGALSSKSVREATENGTANQSCIGKATSETADAEKFLLRLETAAYGTASRPSSAPRGRRIEAQMKGGVKKSGAKSKGKQEWDPKPGALTSRGREGTSKGDATSTVERARALYSKKITPLWTVPKSSVQTL
jgi:hypothetical protein